MSALEDARRAGLRIGDPSARRDRDHEGWKHDSYRVRLAMGERTMTLPFRKGTAHAGSPPTLEEVVECVASDCASLGASPVGRISDFEEWALDLGYDPDSRQAEKVYRAVVKQAEQFYRLLGPDHYEAIVWPESEGEHPHDYGYYEEN